MNKSIISSIKLLKSFSIYTFGSILQGAIAFLLLPVLTNYLSPVDYGKLSILLIIISVFAPIVTLQSLSGISVAFFNLKEKIDFNKYIYSSVYNTLISLACVYVILIISGKTIAHLLNISYFWLMIAPLMSWLPLILQILLTIFQVQQEEVKYIKLSISNILTNILISLLFVVILNWGYEGRLLGIFFTNILLAFIAYIYLSRNGFITKRIVKAYQLDSLKMGIPLIPHAIAGFVITYSDRFFILEMVDEAAVGIYSVAYTLGTIMLILANSFSTAWNPILFTELKSEKPNYYKIKKISLISAMGFVAAFLVLILVTPLIFRILIDSKYSSGIGIVFWTAFAYMFTGFYKIAVGHFFFHKKIKYLSYIAIIKAIFNIVLNYFLIGAYGIIGAAYSTLFTMILEFILAIWMLSYIYPSFSFRKIKL